MSADDQGKGIKNKSGGTRGQGTKGNPGRSRGPRVTRGIPGRCIDPKVVRGGLGAPEVKNDNGKSWRTRGQDNQGKVLKHQRSRNQGEAWEKQTTKE